jgi:hypothetical protein
MELAAMVVEQLRFLPFVEFAVGRWRVDPAHLPNGNF